VSILAKLLGAKLLFRFIFWWARIFSVAIGILNLSILAVDYQLSLLVYADFSRAVNSLGFGFGVA